ncbi:hypothetical protein SAMN02745164_01707 [Marinitoga hydrogenitolerans DSM 16785]|uniref:Uncharacterized protein n=1 Tax=Marinitoga hydrogenitolerans (strain DSM 16785 / JCM 12826 / AT1271) TaxID=1122195 RepID=A0A1M4YLM1_MARH1|nr:hypothetical protein [Marinitoga hydrogenitolerans]SHF06699.1 hypothetical protein SAMN02745164_01707 [Marinitoga hydrogenitolerans DSM 16785]
MNNSTIVFNQKNYQLLNLVSDIESGIIALPDIQRPLFGTKLKLEI